MKKGNKKLFQDKRILSDMLALRVHGWSTLSLAKLYKCDRKAIEKQCDKYGARPENSIYIVESIMERYMKNREKTMEDTRQWFVTNGVKVCSGKNYRDYFK